MEGETVTATSEAEATASYLTSVKHFDEKDENGEKISSELQNLVQCFKKHAILQDETHTAQLNKDLFIDVFETLLSKAIPDENKNFTITTSNALFIYLLETTAKIRNSQTLFVMDEHWKLMFKGTKKTGVPLLHNGSFSILDEYSTEVEFENAQLAYNAIKTTMTKLLGRQGQKKRRLNNKRKLESFEEFQHKIEQTMVREYSETQKFPDKEVFNIHPYLCLKIFFLNLARKCSVRLL
jgi:hypothetical protein